MKAGHRRYYRIAGITIEVEADLPITDRTFHPKFRPFEVEGPGEDTISIRHHFALPDLSHRDLGEEVYRKSPWAIYRGADAWTYVGIFQPPVGRRAGLGSRVLRSILPRSGDRMHKVAIVSRDHAQASVYSPNERGFRRGRLRSLSSLPTDQILLARVLASREGCYIHAGGAVLDGKGLLFVGHSEAGKTTMLRMLSRTAEVLCDDRIIVRRGPQGGFRIHGTWSHGDLAQVSPASAPLRAILFLAKARENRLVPSEDRRETMGRLLACLVKPLATADWWGPMLALLSDLARQVPCYTLQFARGGQVVELLRDL